MNSADLENLKSIVQNICSGASRSYDWVPLIIGALLAILGGALVEYIKKVINRREERQYIVIMLKDELEEIIKTVDKLEETWEKTKNVHRTYLEELKCYNTAYEHNKNRLFLLSTSEARKKVTKFYRDLQKDVTEWADKAGTLSDDPASKTEQESIKIIFTGLRGYAQGIINDDLK